MGLQVTDRKFKSQLINGEDFSLLPGDFGTHTKGSVMERLQATYQLDVFWNSYATDVIPFEFEVLSGTIHKFTREAGSFFDDGWVVGDTCDVDFDTALAGPYAGTVLFVDDLEMHIDIPLIASSGTPDNSTWTFDGTTPLEGFLFNFGLIENSEAINFSSKVTGVDQGYTAEGVGAGSPGPRSTAPVDCLPLGTTYGWQTGTAKINYDSNPTTYRQRFILVHDFLLVPYYIDGQLTNLQNLIVPNLFNGNSTIKYVIRTELRNVLSNPNTAKVGVDDLLDGSVGWFNENYNGLQNNFQILSVAYEDALAAAAQGLLVDEVTTVTIRVKSLEGGGTFTGASKFGVYLSYLPDQADYQNQAEVYTDIWMYEGKIQTIGAGAVAGTIISDLTGTLIGADEIEISFKVTYSAAQKIILDATKSYVIGIQVADTSLDTDDSDKVMLLADVQNYVKSADVPGLMDFTKVDIVPHPAVLGVDSVTDLKTWVEDGFLTDTRFSLALDEDAELITLTAKLVAWKAADNTYFELDSVPIDLSGQTLVPTGAVNVQQIAVNTTRNFALAAGDQFNLVALETDNLVGTDQFYNLQAAFKMNWQEWVALPGADPVFFTLSQDHDGLNNLSSNYSLANGYAMRVLIEANVSNGDSITTYGGITPDFDVRYYDLPATSWTGAISLENQSATDIGAILLSDENTRVKALFDQLSGAVTDLTDFYGIIRIEEQQQPGFAINELSSLILPPASNILTPLTGETLAKLSLVGGDVLVEADIDYTQLDPTKSYKLSARLGSKTIAAVAGKTTEAGANKTTEAGALKTLDP